MTAAIEKGLSEREAAVQASQTSVTRLLWEQEAETRWAKLDHLLYLPVLGLTRPHDLYYYQGQGLAVLDGFTYKYLTAEHFLGRLSRLEVGAPLAATLAQAYTQAWYPGASPLGLYVDWHVKPHWTKARSHSGAVTMWGRVMPGTKQLLVNGPEGQPLIGWNKPIDSHLSGVLVELEAELSRLLARPIAYTIFDSEGGGLPLGQRYRAAKRSYLSHLPRQDYRLSDFEALGQWQPVNHDPQREVVQARWQDPLKAKAEGRDLVLMRPVGQTDPTRIYTGNLPAELNLTEIPGSYRRRWSKQERVIRELVKGANLNANFGYTYQDVPHRTIQRQWAEAQERVESTQRQLAQHHQAGRNLRQKLRDLDHSYRSQYHALRQTLLPGQTEFLTRQANGQPWRRCQQRLAQTYARLDQLTQRYHHHRQKLLTQLQQRGQQLAQTQAELTQRRQVRDALDTASLCRERTLEKDQVIRRTISLCSICNCYWTICIIGPALTSLLRPGSTWN